LNNVTNNREPHDAAFYRPANAPLSPRTGQSCANPRECAIWLAAAIDGEGYFSLDYFTNRRGVPCGSPKIIISNCNEEFVKKVEETIFVLARRKPLTYCSRRPEEKHNDIYRVRLNDQRSIRKVCEAVLPHLTAKRRQAEILIEFCLLRKAKKHTPDSPYDEREFSLMTKMKEAQKAVYKNHGGGASTERDALVN
jgi:hypothetical protein